MRLGLAFALHRTTPNRHISACGCFFDDSPRYASVSKGSTVPTRRVPRCPLPLACLKAMPAVWLLSLTVVAPSWAQEAKAPPVSIGAGVQTSFMSTIPEEDDSTEQFLL